MEVDAFIPQASGISRDGDPNLHTLGPKRSKWGQRPRLRPLPRPGLALFYCTKHCCSAEKTQGKVTWAQTPFLPCPLTWCLLIMSFSFPSSLGSISGQRKMFGRDRQLFCGEKKLIGQELGAGSSRREGRRQCGGVCLNHYLHQGLLNGHKHFHVAVHAGRVLEIVTAPCEEKTN